jgi:beta-lactamase superfamily II metal-dependent hydrolase
MGELKMTVFNVERGLCIFVRSPNGYGVLIDCGKSEKFSPVKWIVENMKNHLTQHNGYALAWLIVTHPHDDHVEDIDYLKSYLPPAILCRQKSYDWDSILLPESGEASENMQTYYDWQQTYNVAVTEYPDLGMEMQRFALTPTQAERIDDNTQHLLNNSSYVTVFAHKGWKLVVSGDNELSGWNKLLENDAFCAAVKGASFFVTSHHGHRSGFCPGMFDIMGRPWINVTSEKSGDESVEPLYSSEKYARGITFSGKKRYHLTTRRDGSIIVRIKDEQNAYVDAYSYPDNLL